MDCKGILAQYIDGKKDSKNALAELQKCISQALQRHDNRDAAIARYVIGFIQRSLQLQNGEASEKDMCLNIRDIILVMGRIKLNEALYSVALRFGEEFGLICESEFYVSCLLQLPRWLEPHLFVKDVYALKEEEDNEISTPSVGDSTLVKHTIFKEYKSFEQKVAIHTAMCLPQGSTLLVSQPTGGGKSLITQMVASTSDGLTVVIVPTVALALDQYHSALHNLNNDEEIYCYRGEQSDSVKEKIINALNEHRARILFSSPEAILKNVTLRRALDEGAKSNYLKNVVIDEAHIIPDWGVFFRPDFQIFSIVLKKWNRESNGTVRTYLLSATLSDDVVDTLFSLFGTPGKNVQIRCDTLRREPRYYFCSVNSSEEQEKRSFDAIRLLPKPMIVYVLEPREAIKLRNKLIKYGYRNIPVFTGETKEIERDRVLRGWKKQKYDVIIATSAFGIGVDKPDVRTIVHACCPENLSRFYQEVGRGGRDQFPSISLFMPCKNKDGKEGDVQRALGLVNKRVLTVDRTVVRWKSLLSSSSALINADECILDTSVPPITMTDEEAEYAGNQNVAWNINLLLFLYRTRFIDLVDAEYIINQKKKKQKKYYSVTVKLLQTDVLSDYERFEEALKNPRKQEYELQMKGYRLISDLVSSPKAKCWGKVFKNLFPLSRDVCNGCPADPKGRVTSDQAFKLRLDPAIKISSHEPSCHLARRMGSLSQLIVSRLSNGAVTDEEIDIVAKKATKNQIGVLVVPNRFNERVSHDGIVMNYNEFLFSVDHCKYLFANGLICVLENDNAQNITIYKAAEKMDELNYRRIYYCNDNAIVTSNGKTIREVSDGYTISLDTL